MGSRSARGRPLTGTRALAQLDRRSAHLGCPDIWRRNAWRRPARRTTRAGALSQATPRTSCRPWSGPPSFAGTRRGGCARTARATQMWKNSVAVGHVLYSWIDFSKEAATRLIRHGDRPKDVHQLVSVLRASGASLEEGSRYSEVSRVGGSTKHLALSGQRQHRHRPCAHAATGCCPRKRRTAQQDSRQNTRAKGRLLGGRFVVGSWSV